MAYLQTQGSWNGTLPFVFFPFYWFFSFHWGDYYRTKTTIAPRAVSSRLKTWFSAKNKYEGYIFLLSFRSMKGRAVGFQGRQITSPWSYSLHNDNWRSVRWEKAANSEVIGTLEYATWSRAGSSFRPLPQVLVSPRDITWETSILIVISVNSVTKQKAKSTALLQEFSIQKIQVLTSVSPFIIIQLSLQKTSMRTLQIESIHNLTINHQMVDNEGNEISILNLGLEMESIGVS